MALLSVTILNTLLHFISHVYFLIDSILNHARGIWYVRDCRKFLFVGGFSTSHLKEWTHT